MGLGIVFRDRRVVTSAVTNPNATLDEIEMQLNVCDGQAVWVARIGLARRSRL